MRFLQFRKMLLVEIIIDSCVSLYLKSPILDVFANHVQIVPSLWMWARCLCSEASRKARGKAYNFYFFTSHSSFLEKTLLSQG